MTEAYLYYFSRTDKDYCRLYFFVEFLLPPLTFPLNLAQFFALGFQIFILICINILKVLILLLSYNRSVCLLFLHLCAAIYNLKTILAFSLSPYILQNICISLFSLLQRGNFRFHIQFSL